MLSRIASEYLPGSVRVLLGMSGDNAAHIYSRSLFTPATVSCHVNLGN